jgi:hypothetical protein
MSIAEDLRDHIRGMTSLKTVTEQESTIRQVIQGVQVRQRAVNARPDPIAGCDTAYLDVIVMGVGERGLENAWTVAEGLYRELMLLHDMTINQTLYIKIQTDSAPYEVGSTYSQEDRWVQFGLEVVRYMEA